MTEEVILFIAAKKSLVPSFTSSDD